MLKIQVEKKKHVIEYMGAKFTVLPNTKKERNQIIENNTKSHKVKAGPGKKSRYDERIDFVEVLAENIDSQVVAWSGIASKLECNSTNKRALALNKENEHICAYIQAEIEAIGQAKEEDETAKTKN